MELLITKNGSELILSKIIDSIITQVFKIRTTSFPYILPLYFLFEKH